MSQMHETITYFKTKKTFCFFYYYSCVLQPGNLKAFKIPARLLTFKLIHSFSGQRKKCRICLLLLQSYFSSTKKFLLLVLRYELF